MSEIEQIERRVEGLPPEELAKFRAWFLEFDAHVWDKQIEADARAGILDSLISDAMEAYKAGKTREL